MIIECKDFSEIDNIYETDTVHIVGTLEQAAKFKNLSDDELGDYYSVKSLDSVYTKNVI